MTSKHVNARGGNENAQLLGRAFRQPLQRQGRAQPESAEMLEGSSGVSGEGDIGVKGEAVQARTTRFLLVHDGRGRVQTAHGMTGAGTVAHCHLGLGKLYRRTGKREQATEHLTTAAALLRDMEVQFWLEQAEAELKALG